MTGVIEDILNKTNRGRDLIVECYPQFEGIADDKKVKLRDEKEGSAHIHLYNNVYILKDFGDGPGKDGINVYAELHQMERKDAIHVLAVRYGLDKSGSNAFAPKIETRPLTGDLRPGERKFELKDSFSREELKFLGPQVTEEIAAQLSWHSVARIIYCKDDHEVWINSTATYPIFSRDLHDMNTGEVIGHKIYQPRYQTKADGKNYKFSYYPKGIEPGSYVHGLYELERALKNGETISKVAIVCGERDALVTKSMGVFPIWLNSETKDMPPSLVARLFEIAKEIYYIPDVDSTGKREGLKTLKSYPRLKTVWLPKEMKSKVGDQFKPCKDLRDWASMNPKKHDFNKLLNTAKRYQFWEKTENGNLVLNQDSLLYFLNMNGYCRVKNGITDEYEFVHIENHIVKKISVEDIRLFVIEWSQNETATVRNLLLKNRKTAMDQLNDLAVTELSFDNASSNSQVFCFENKQIVVTDEDIYEVDKDSRYFFWDKQVVRHRLELLPPMFEIDHWDEKDRKSIAIAIKTDSCKLFQFLIKTSMIYWQLHEADIELTKEQEEEEMKSLVSKIFAIGYLLHRHRQKSRDWAPLLMDNNTRPDSPVAEGGTGKSFIFTDVLPNFGYNVVVYSAKKKNPMEDDFIFDQVTPDTEIFFIDECPDGFEFDKLNSYITDSLTVNPKHKKRTTIPYKQAPKFVFATNFVPHDFGGSAMRRHMPEPYSDYFHYTSPNNGFKTSRTIHDEFGMVLMDENYPWEDWNRDFNFLLQCEMFYLRVVNEINDKLTPDMTNIMKRHNSSQYSDEFDDWADQYFSDKNHLNCEILADAMVTDYNQGHFPKIDKKSLKRQLKAWTECHGLVLNPDNVCNDHKGHRIKCVYHGITTEKFHVAGVYDGE